MKTPGLLMCVLVWMGCGGGSGTEPDAGTGVPGQDGAVQLDAAMEKTCGGEEVDPADPATGCAAASCDACPLPAGATVTACSNAGTCDHVCRSDLHKTATGCGPAALQIAAVTNFAASDFTCAVTTERTVRCWGELSDSLSDPPLWNTSVPQLVTGLANVEQLSAGASHLCATTTGGIVKCWGRNDQGQLGDGTTTSSATPVTVVGLPAAAASVSAGFSHSCAALVTGDVWCWGSNTNQVLGRTTTTPNSNPPGAITFANPGITELSSSRWHTCGLRTNGHVLCWGANLSGELGTGAFSSSSLPIEVIGLTNAVAVHTAGDASSVSLGGMPASGGHSWAVRTDGTVVAWGYQTILLGLGQGTTKISTPTVIPQLSSVIELSHGPDHVCATTSTGKAMCWGRGGYGKLGMVGMTATNKLVYAPTHMADFGSNISHVATGRAHTCMVFDTELRCAGSNLSGQLGNGTTSEYSAVPLTVTW